ncbi:hypothetical protein ESA94_05255 [Lacibacter luteus]|uniref:Uncharacterized protein n=1 Tax=Lacibacter luteus TaxID=2508719 RepID=A0A4Q1CMV4_9BACT|nr:hypothetical protein [Lacibacter luteus]RXK62417.1 hypothetical protein ESA94_05255 [Lacibacter luteus]
MATVVAFAQNPVGVWEGSFFLQGDKKNKMNVRLELMETDTELVGIISTRGYNKGTVYGCDYLVSGRMNQKGVRLIRKNVRRGVAMTTQDCSFFQRLELNFSNAGNDTLVNCKWIWANEEGDLFTAKKTDSAVSESAKEEVETYLEEVYTSIELAGIMLQPEERLYQKIAEIEVDSSELVIDISSVEKNINDSVTILLNDEPVAEAFSLYKKPLRIRVHKVQPGRSDIIVINQSQSKSKLSLQITVKQKELVKEYKIEPGFVRNIMLVLVQKQE